MKPDRARKRPGIYEKYGYITSKISGLNGEATGE